VFLTIKNIPCVEINVSFFIKYHFRGKNVMDFYTITLEKRFKLLEKRITRTQKEMEFLKHSYANRKKAQVYDNIVRVKQMDMFTA
jgi:hypothetical protein